MPRFLHEDASLKIISLINRTLVKSMFDNGGDNGVIVQDTFSAMHPEASKTRRFFHTFLFQVLFV